MSDGGVGRSRVREFNKDLLMILDERDPFALRRRGSLVRFHAVRMVALVFLALPAFAQAHPLAVVAEVTPSLILGSDDKASTGLDSPTPLQSFVGITPASSTPPDSHGAVSSTHVMTQINGQSVIRDRNGALLTSVTLASFYASLGVTDVFDPKVVFDHYSNRFLTVACAQRRSSASGMVFGVSATSDPTGTWHLWLFDADPSNVNWVDYPNIGVTANRITFTGNLFSVASDAFGGANIWVLDKASALDGGGTTHQLMKVSDAGGTLVPAYTYDAAETTQYIIRVGTSNLFGTGRLQVYSIAGSIGSLTFTQATNASLASAWSITLPNAKQQGTTATIETNDDRLMNAVLRNGSIWTAHAVGFNTTTRDHTAVKWWQVAPTTGLTIQSGLIEDVDALGNFDNTTGRYYYYPSVAVNNLNEVLIGFTGSGALEFPSGYYAFRPATAGTGLFNNPFQYKAGLGAYNGPRWGDYSNTVVDPVDDTSFWTVQEFGNGSNQTANFWAKVGQGATDSTNPRVSGATALTGTTVRVTFDETMQDNAALVNAANYTFTGGLTAASVVRLNTTQVTVTVNEMVGGQAYTLSVSTSGPSDLAGNTVSATGNTAGFTGLGGAPTAVIALDNPSPTNLNTVNFSVDFSESVGTSFTVADVTVTGSLSTASTAAVTGGPIEFTVQVTPTNPNAEGTIGLSIGTGITDLVGNTFAGGSSPSSYTLDNTAPAVGVNTLLTNDQTPQLTGTVNDNGAAISITVGGQTRTATNNANGTWTLANNALSTLADGTYNVVATATDTAGNSASDATANELTVDGTAPTITVTSRLTNDTTPQLSGTVSEPGAVITIVVSGQTRTATNVGDGTWVLPDGSLNPISDGTYNVAATASDAVGNSGSDATTNELTIDATSPVLTVNTLVTNDTRPPLSGTTSDLSSAISVTVGGQTRTATNNGNGTWTLADNAITPALAAGVYNVAVTSTDTAGNTGSDSTSNELTIDTTPPTITVNTLTTNDTTPPLSGTVNDLSATISITVGGQTRTATNNGNGTWTLANNSLTALAQGTFNVAATATDTAGNSATDSTSNELVIDTTAPTVTVSALVTSDTTPPLGGTVNDAGATISVTVNGQTRTATNNGTTWSLADGSLSALPQGTYNVAVTATDPAGNAGTDATSNELTVDTTAPTITVNTLNTTDSTPALTGTVSETTATIRVTVGTQVNLTATNNGNGTWTLPNNTLTTLADGVYNVVATATDAASNSGTDATTNELTVDATAPAITVNTLLTNDARPPLTGTVNDTAASISISVGGQTRTATNNGNGTWTLANDAISPALASGTYNVAATATDAAGNAGSDATTNELTVDTVAPTITVTSRTTNDSTPSLSGTINDNAATISVTVGGQTRTATNNANGTWTLADGSLTALAAGTYNVAATATDLAGNAGVDATTNELVIDLTAPVITVNSLTTSDTTPPLSGTINDNTATISITVSGQTRAATNNGNGTWTLANNSLSALGNGVFNVVATATDTAGNSASDTTTNELTVDTVAPVITVNSLSTTDTTPPLTGTVSETGASISVTVGGQTRAATNNGNGTWTLADGQINPALASGTYNVAATATDAAGNAGSDSTTNELVIDNAAPTVTVNSLNTNDQRPQLTGTVNDNAATIRVTVGGQVNLVAVNNGNGTWTLPDNTINPNLAAGTYNVAVSATDTTGNVGNDATANELVIDVTAPTVAVNSLLTNDTRPALTGTVNDNNAVITVAVGGQTHTATNNANGTWTLADNTISPALAQGTYNVSVTATDLAGNSGNDATSNELAIDTSAPTIAVNARITSDTRPELTGTTNDTTAVIRVDVGGQTNLAAVNNGDGTWTLPDNTINPALANGTFSVTARATDGAGNIGTDATSNELTIDSAVPVITVTALITANNRPALSGTVNETGALISVTVSGQTNAATNNGNGTWTLAANTLTALPDGVYSVQATATDLAGNAGSDATNSELTIDTTGPTVAVNTLTTNNTRPALTGTINDTTATLTVDVGGQSGLAATNNGNGTWTLPVNTINPGLADGAYNVTVNATDTLGNPGTDATTNELTIDTTLTVTVNSLTTSDTTPALSGTIDDTTATISVTVDGNAYAGVNNGNGTWTLADNTIAPPLVNGTFEVAVTATDSLGNTANDATTNELEIDATAPTVTVDVLATTDTRPQLTGTVSTPAATITVDVGGQNGLAATNNGDGTWTLADDTINPGLADGVYNVIARATFGGTGTDSTTNELTIDTAAPVTTVDSRTTNDTRPSLSGTVNEPSATLTLDVDAQAGLAVTNNGDGTWSLADDVINPALAAGTYDVTINATDAVGNVSNITSVGALVIDLTAPTITVNALTTGDTTPAVTGTVNDNGATIQVDVGAQLNLVATNNGDGTWTLPDNTVTPLGGGTTSVVARATDTAGNVGTDGTNNELTIDTTAPAITVDLLSTADNTPQLTGTVNDAAATISITVGGQTLAATNNGATWTLANNTLTTLADGTYNVAATATDPQGNAGVDGTTNELRVDTTAPVVSVNNLTTSDNRPALSGNVNDFSAVVTVSVGGQLNLAAVNNGNGTWTLPDNTINPALPDNTYNVTVTATDTLGNAASDATTNELRVLTTPPVVTVTPRTTNDTTPSMSGTVNDTTATVVVRINSLNFGAVNNGNGTWTLPDNTISPALAEGVYSVIARATNQAGIFGQDPTNNELTIDVTPPTVSVNTLVTSDTRPALSGTTNSITATIRVDVGGQNNLLATNNGNGTWTLADNTVNPALAQGSYNVVARATDLAGNVGTESTTNELLIDTAAPAVTITSQTTNDNTPGLAGTLSDNNGTATVTVSVTVNGQTRTATVTGGTWAVANGALNTIPDGTYNVQVTATDLAGNAGTDATNNELTVDTAAPTVTVNALNTNDRRPPLTGTVNDNSATIRVSVAGQTNLLATNNANGTWTLADNTLTTLGDGTYNVQVTATDTAGNAGADATTDELRIDGTAPAITLTPRLTNDNTPALSGTVNDTTATIAVTVSGNTFAGVNNGDGTWTLADNTIAPALAAGTYSVTARATDSFGNIGTDATSNELVVDLQAPVITVDAFQTNDDTPPLTGTVNDSSATITVSVGGQVDVPATNNGNGTWTLPDGTLTALADGVYSVTARATDLAGNSATDATNNELTINSEAPTVTVNALATNDNTPALTGTVDDPAATITIATGGQTGLAATNNGDGTWTLPDNTLAVLADGVYNVVAEARDAQNNVAADATTSELSIDTVAPAVTVDNLTTNDNRPPLSGTVSDPGAALVVGVNGEVGLPAVNNGDGTWTLPDNTITGPLPDSALGYDVAVTATDGVGNTGADTTANELKIDTTAPVLAINTVATNAASPQLTGTIDDNFAQIQVTVNGETRTAANNSNGTWTLASGQLSALGSGTYDITAQATDEAGNTGNANLPGGLTVDVTPPVVSVNTLVTTDTTPQLTGTVDDPAAVVSVSVAGQTNAAVNNGNGTWTLGDNTLTALADGAYDVDVTATDSLGNAGVESTSNELTVDTSGPVVTVDTLFTNDTTPALSGTIGEAGVAIVVTVAGNTYNALNNGDGTWTLADGTIAPPLAAGTYDTMVVATDGLGNVGADSTVDELVVDLTPPIITVATRLSTQASPDLGGTVDDIFATVTVNVGGQTRTATNIGNGTWALVAGTLDPLASGVYDVAATATDLAGNVANDATTNELTIDLDPPVVAVDELITNDSTPPLTGDVDDSAATVTITVAGQTLNATNNGDGTWTIADNVLSPLSDGAYNVQAVATDVAGNTGTDPTLVDDLIIITVAPVVSVIPQTTGDTTPQVNGLINQTTSSVSVTIDGQTLAAVNNGDGSWTLPNDMLTALAEGAYDVLAEATDRLGNTGTDTTTDELVIDLDAPQITVNALSTRDRTPALSGTVSATTAAVSITVGGQTVDAVNNGDGTWTLPDDTLEELADGTYDVLAVAQGAVDGTDSTVNELFIDTLGPSITVGGPSVLATQSGPVSFNLHYGEGAQVGLLLSDVSTFALLDPNVTVLGGASGSVAKSFPISTATAQGTISISGTGNEVRTVTVSDTSGDGFLGIAVIGGSAVDAAGNPADAAASVELAYIDNTAPAVESGGVANLGILIISFNEPMNDTALVPGNYTISGPGQGTLASNPDLVIRINPQKYRLVWSTGASVNGEEITITAVNVADAVTNLIGANNAVTVLVEGVGAAPVVSDVEVLGALAVAVRFSEPIDSGALEVNSYVLSGTGKGTLAANPASISELPTVDPENPDITFPENRNGYRLTWDGGEMREDGDITITVSNVLDNSGDAIGVPASATDPGAGIGTPPVVTAVRVITGLTVEAEFSEPMGAGALDPANYVVGGAGRGTLAANPDNVALVEPGVYLLTWNAGEMVNGRDIVITAANVFDEAGNALGTPASATAVKAGRDGLITASIVARRDTTLYEDAEGDVSNGAGASLFAGLGQDGLVRRGLLHFDVVGNIPAGSTIVDATLAMESAALAGNATPRSVSLQLLSTDWDEGDSDAGAPGLDGVPAADGDATWLHTRFDTEFWANAGGDFVPGARAATSVAGAGAYLWDSDLLIADTQSWLDDPDANFGWMVTGEEATAGSVKQFFTSEHAAAAQRPLLQVVYSLNGGPGGPVLGTIGDQQVAEGETITLDLTAVDPTDDEVAIAAALASLPPDHTATLADNGDGTAQFSWTPSFVDSGSYVITFIATEVGVADPLSVSETIVIDVAEVNQTPVFQDPDPQAAVEGQLFTFMPVLTDGDVGDTHTYLLSAELGDAAVDATTGMLTWTPGFSDAGDYTLGISVVDSGTPPHTVSLQIPVSVTDANGAPAIAPIGNQNIVERETLSFNVVASDPDLGDTLAYSLEDAPAGSGIDPVSGLFTWTPTIIQAGEYDVGFVVIDNGAPPLSATEVVRITVVDDNQDPSDIALAPSSVTENQPAGTVVGSLSSTDPDAADVHAYTLVDGEGGADNSQFVIAGNQIQTAAVFNFEERSSYSVRVQSFDGKDGTFARALTVSVVNANDLPQSIALSNQTVTENVPVGTAIGVLTTVDEDSQGVHSYTLVDGDGATDNGLFAVSDTSLVTASAIDFEEKANLSVRVRSTDAGGATVDAVFAISVDNVNDTPDSVSLSANRVDENAPAGTPVGTFMADDADSGDTHEYTLVSGEGSADNAKFQIAGDELSTSMPLDFEQGRFLSIRVRTSDGQSVNFEMVFQIEVMDRNDAPVDVAISAAGLLDNVPADTKVGDLFTSDQDIGDSHTYILVSGSGSQNNNRFTIVDGALFTAQRVNFGSSSEFNVRIRTTDQAGASFEKAFVLRNDDVDGDGVSDAWELANFGDLNATPEADSDQDGLNNLQEFQRGTNPRSADSDGDGVNDGVEVNLGTDPNNGADAPASLRTTPSALSIGREAGVLSFTVRNVGQPPLNWTAQVTTGADFVEITSGQSGTDGGQVTVSVAANTSASARSATIRITAPKAIGSPLDVPLNQAACSTPGVPSDVLASNGSLPGQVRITWDPVEGSDRYMVLRGLTEDPNEATLIATVTGTAYTDSSAPPLGGAKQTADPGCFLLPSPLPDADAYLYWVRATSVCGTSDFSEPNDGFPGEGEPPARELFEPVLPGVETDNRTLTARPDSTLAIRLRRDTAIDPASLSGVVEAASGASTEIQWLAIDTEGLTDGWALFTPEADQFVLGESVTFTVSASTVAGESIGPLSFDFTIEPEETFQERIGAGVEPIFQPAYTDFDASGIDLSQESNDQISVYQLDSGALPSAPANAVGPAYALVPDEAYRLRQRVWIPLSGDLRAEDVDVNYYFTDKSGELSGWYRASSIQGWSGEDSVLELELDGVRYVGFLVRHAARIQLSAPGAKAASASVSIPGLAPSRGGDDILVFGALLGLMLVLPRAMRKMPGRPRS